MRAILKVLGLVLLGAALQAGDSYDYHVDEAKNALGPNRCADSRDCDGRRTCSPFGWCQGTARPAAKPAATAAVMTVEVTRVVTVLVTPAPTAAPAQPEGPLRPPHERPLPDTRPGPGAEREHGAGLGGRWEGAFGRSLQGPQTTLTLQLQQEPEGLSGQADLVTPPQKPGDATVVGNGLVNGRVERGGRVRLKLMQRGVVGPDTLFSGRLSKDGGQIQGSWRRGAKHGVFALRRTVTAEGKNTQLNPAAYSILNGRWLGEWDYADHAFEPCEFSLELTQAQDRFQGASLEPNTFPGTKAAERHATISDGRLQPDGKLSWRKTYDGAEGIRHTVLFDGQMADDGQAAQGTWRIEGKNRGRWRMNKINGAVMVKGKHLLVEEGGAGQGPLQVAVDPSPVPSAVPTAGSVPPRPQPAAQPSPAPTVAPSPLSTLQPSPASPVPAPAAPLEGALAGPWGGNAEAAKGLSPVTLNLVFAPQGGVLGGHGIVRVHRGPQRERNVDIVDGSYKADGSLRFSLHFSEPEEDDMNLNFRGQLQGNQKLIQGGWDESGSAEGQFQLHRQDGGQ